MTGGGRRMTPGGKKMKFGRSIVHLPLPGPIRLSFMALRIMLVDDEAPCRAALRSFLHDGCPEARIVGEAASLSEAVRRLEQQAVDVLLLDVDLGDGTGFDLLDRFPEPGFRVVFTTAHDEFALRAFRYSALDYLLKPVDPADLVAAVRRLNFRSLAEHQRQLEQLRQQSAGRDTDRITLNTGDGLLFIRTQEIVRLEAQGNYSFAFLENGERHLVTRSLTAFEEILPSPPFFRAHQSHLINTAFVRKLVRDNGDQLLMTDKTAIPLARRRRELFSELMKTTTRA